MENLIVRKYKSGDNILCKDFNSGNIYLDSFIKSEDLALDVSFGCTYLALFEKSQIVVGYYTITTGSVDYLYDDIRIKSGGSVHVECLAVDKKYQKTVFLQRTRYFYIL